MEDQHKNLDEVLTNLKEMYMSVQKLLDETKEQNEVDKSQPHENKYAAVELLKIMRDTLNFLNNVKQNDDKFIPMFGVIYLNLGIVYIETEELNSGEENLTKCIECLNDTIKSETVLPLISALNQLGVLWFCRDQPEKAKTFFERAELTYKKYKESGISTPTSMAALFDVQDENEITPSETIENLYTLTLCYMAQVYSSLKKHLESATYCCATLSRQLEQKDMDHINCVLNTATLSQVFMENGKFSLARHHLGAATYILKQHKECLEKNEKGEDDETMAAKWEKFNHRSADVARCWAMYGIILLSSYIERLIENSENDGSATSGNDMEQINDTLKDLKFSSIESDIEQIVKNVTDKYLLDFDDAVVVFRSTKNWLEEAKKFYSLENHASDYVQVVQDISQAYKYLAFFEEDESRRAKMHKCRVNILEGVVKELNPKYYLAACREIWVELGETYSEIRDIKFERLRTLKGKPPAQLLAKANHLAAEGIRNIQLFLDSLKDFENADGIRKFPEEMIRPALCCYFSLGRLHNSFLKLDREKQLENTKKSLEAYMFLVNYCENDPKARELMIGELFICKDLVKLLPLKIEKMMQSTS